MGLGAPKKRTKLSHDPNNTTWAKSTTNYGHKILSKQGWTPGSYLGAENAAHAEHYGAANASHIRVLLREDNLGLGAKIGGNGRAETFGLATLSGIFGRLNGKSDEAVQKQQSALRDAELRSWHAGKHGFMNFVRGGYLVGDKVQDTLDNKPQSTLQSSIPTKKKRKAAEMEDVPGLSTKKAKSERIAKSEPQSEPEESDDAAVKEQTKEKKKKSKHSEDDQSGTAKQQIPDETDQRAVRKAEKKARKEERRKRKEEKRLRKAAKEAKKVAAIIPAPDLDPSSSSSESDSTPAQSTGVSTPQFAGSRHAVRQRYIQQKRMASMNPQALKEILMLKAQG